MHLLIDIGNRYLKWRAGDFHGAFAIAPDRIETKLDAAFSFLDNVAAVFFVCVAADQLSAALKEYSSARWGIEAKQIFSAKQQCGVHSLYDDSSELGADRWAALVGAWSITQRPAIVIDCGTAITVDALNHNGEFIGGSILPGFDLAAVALEQQTAAIADSREFTPALPARSTAEAVSSGIVIGTVYAIEGLIRDYRKLGGGADDALVLTGGQSHWLQKYSRLNFKHCPELVLDGLSLIVRECR